VKRGSGFRVEWSAEDGYVGKGRPQELYVAESDVEDCATDEELERLLDDMVRDDFDNKVSPSVRNSDEFIAWARGVIEARRLAEPNLTAPAEEEGRDE
jgi:hypothetical protein